MITISPKELEVFAEFTHARTGIVINSSKAYLLENRLAPLLDEAGAKSFFEFFQIVSHSPEWTTRIIDAITTNETSFFRDQRPFDLLHSTLLPEIINRRKACRGSMPLTLNIWSAACSTGQEVYSVAMILAEFLGKEAREWNIKITGSDISTAVLSKASQGEYTPYEVDRGVPNHLRAKYFVPKGEMLVIRPELRAMTTFRKINLLAPAENIGQFDLVFCRNVGIYFNQENRCRLFTQIAGRLHAEGVLIIGSTESLIGVCDCFIRHEAQNTAFFRKR